MPSPADSNLDASSTSLLVPNSFLLFRLVSFALLSNLALLQLIFTSWNTSARLSLRLSVPWSSVVIIFGSCILCLYVAFAWADFYWSRGRRSRVLLESVVVGIMSVYQIGAAISSTVNTPVMVLCTSLEWNVCASSLPLVLSTWLSSMLCLAYFLTLFMTTTAHKHLYPDIWSRSVYGVVWLGQPSGRDPCTSQNEDIEKSTEKGPIDNVAPWATGRVRRGIDPPFARQPKGTCLSRSSPMTSASDLSLRSCSNESAASSRFIDKIGGSALLARSGLDNRVHVRQDSFPKSVADVDSPIPLPRLSQWVKADALRGISVHSDPHIV